MDSNDKSWYIQEMFVVTLISTQVAHLKPAQGKNSSSQRLQLLWMDGLWSLIGWKIRLLIKVSWKHCLGCLSYRLWHGIYVPIPSIRLGMLISDQGRIQALQTRSGSAKQAVVKELRRSEFPDVSRGFTWFLRELSWTGQPWNQWRNLLVTAWANNEALMLLVMLLVVEQ